MPDILFYFIAELIVVICVLLVLGAVLIDFIEFQSRKHVKKEKKSIVETGTMLLFFGFFYFLISSGIGRFVFDFFYLRISFIMLGLLILIIGCYTNIVGRLKLGRNWSNQIKIYADHVFISDGAYKYIRHPLYASIIWMFFGASLVYGNYLAFLANALIFVPFMYYRAKQEEVLLVQEFSNYKKYQSLVGMFFPKLINKKI
ncbi:MAG: isoprenylcysteine carboxylmethyltransferase family protein [bacterium]